jgi:hypothetical protein
VNYAPSGVSAAKKLTDNNFEESENTTLKGGIEMLDGKLMSRQEATDYLLATKKAKGLTFEEISKAVGRDKVWVTASIMGQTSMSKEEAEKTVAVLGVSEGLAGQIATSLQRNADEGVARYKRSCRSTDLSLPRNYPSIRHDYESPDSRNVRRRHHERHRF